MSQGETSSWTVGLRQINIAPTTTVNAEPKEIHTIEEADSVFMNYVYTLSVDSGSDANPNKMGVGSILNDLEVAETLVANMTLDKIDDMEKQQSSDDGE
uniref:Uncharacterized protein n=1 Tax=Oryza glaberrima TaxID=4538 RepID=I1QZC8_ORYGL